MQRKQMGFRIDVDLSRKLYIIHTIRKHVFGEDVQISGIINKALEEYFANHKEEIDEMMKKYHDAGGLFQL